MELWGDFMPVIFTCPCAEVRHVYIPAATWSSTYEMDIQTPKRKMSEVYLAGDSITYIDSELNEVTFDKTTDMIIFIN
jgi:hypothetical protein